MTDEEFNEWHYRWNKSEGYEKYKRLKGLYK